MRRRGPVKCVEMLFMVEKVQPGREIRRGDNFSFAMRSNSWMRMAAARHSHGLFLRQPFRMAQRREQTGWLGRSGALGLPGAGAGVDVGQKRCFFSNYIFRRRVIVVCPVMAHL